MRVLNFEGLIETHPTLSIIVPVYNTKEFLPRCVESVLNQSFVDFELILIDDGSCDGCALMCDDYSANDSRIRVFHQFNAGVSSARNLGLDYVRGEWICFLDSDDEFLPGGLQTMIDCIKDDVDMVLAGYERYDENGSVFYSVDERVIQTLNKKRSLSTLYETHAPYYRYLGYICGRLFRKRIIQDNHLRFDPNLRIKEDTLFITRYILRSNGVTCFTTTPVYRYNDRMNSAMWETRNHFNSKYVDSLYALIKMKKEISSFFSSFSELVYIAKEGIWVRYWKIMEKMRKFNIEDHALQSQIKKDVLKEIGVDFFIRKKIKKFKRSVGNLFCES